APHQELQPAVHHVDSAAGRVEPAADAALRRDADRAAAVRRHRARRGRIDGSHHLHAYRLDADLCRRRRQGQRLDQARARREVHRRVAQGQGDAYHDLKPEQHFTQPPPRYTEATLIKELEQRGIGRPSTYAPIVQTITKAHGYVDIKERRLHPTRVGEAVNALMVDHFKSISDDEYTSNLEKRLDEVESGKQQWVPVVRDFYGPLQRMLSA